jgi:hypothetical protein
MNTAIAICCDITAFQGNRCLDKNWYRNFPRASWVPAFAELVKKEAIIVVSGDIALSNVQCGYWNAKDILIIQELNTFHGRALARSGAKPAILTGFESPLIAYSFYDQLSKIAPVFQNRILFSGAFQTFNASSGFNYPAHFPTFNTEDIITPLVSWDKRDFLVLVSANKYWKEPFNIPFFRNPKGYAGGMLEQWRKWKSPTRKLAIKNELQSKRLEAIEFFGNLDRIIIFGPGWDELQRLPLKWQKRLKMILRNLNPEPCDYKNKIETISNYKFAICFENVAYLGYVTEKIIDCFVAGTIPIYFGAPDVQDFIPKEAFIDMRAFDSWERLNNYLDAFGEEDALKMIYAGREFLNTDQGILHSNKGFAQFVMDILLDGGYTK